MTTQDSRAQDSNPKQEIATPPPVLIRIARVMELTGFARSTIYFLVRKGTFPKPIKLGGPRAIGFIESEIEAHIQACIAASRPDDYELLSNLIRKPELRARNAPGNCSDNETTRAVRSGSHTNGSPRSGLRWRRLSTAR